MLWSIKTGLTCQNLVNTSLDQRNLNRKNRKQKNYLLWAITPHLSYIYITITDCDQNLYKWQKRQKTYFDDPHAIIFTTVVVDDRYVIIANMFLLFYELRVVWLTWHKSTDMEYN